MNNQKGFSLIELLIVVVVIGIVAAIAIPNLLAARSSANQASAVSTLRSYHGAQATYQSTVGNGNYAGIPFTLNGFVVLVNEDILDDSLAAGIKNGYTFSAHSRTASSGNPACHLGQAVPTILSGVSATGTTNYVVATEGIIYERSPASNVAGFAGNSGAALCTPEGGFSILNE